MRITFTTISIIILFSVNVFGQYVWNQYQISTNTTTQISYTLVSSASSSYTTGNSGLFPGNYSSDTSRVFLPLDIVNDPNALPWRMTVKFSNTTGILIDPYHVLTAGHAVSMNQAFGNVKFTPAYSQDDSPYGFAYPEYVYMFTAYTSTAATDLAIVKLDRPIGALTGYTGYGYNNDQSFYLSQQIFLNPSYPSAGLFDGNNLYNWKGKADYITNDFAYSIRNGVVGMSGSGLTTYVNGTPVTYGIIVATGIKFNKINANKFDAINKIIGHNTPVVYDAVPLSAKVYPGVLKQGNNPDSVTLVVHNYSLQNCPKSQITANIYVSADSIITPQDQLIKSVTVNSAITAKNSVLVKSTGIDVSALQAGEYWVGAILQGDNNSQNNTTDYRDAYKLTVAGSDYVRISGAVTSSQSNALLSGVSMQGAGGNFVTDCDGRFAAYVPAGWSGTVTPYREGFDFTPSSFTVTNASLPLEYNFTASKKTYNISVSVKSPVQQNPVSGVQITGLPGEPFTNSNGATVINVYHGWSGSAYLIKDGWNLQPYLFEYSKVVTDKDVPATGGFNLSGYLYDANGGPLTGVKIAGFPNTVLTNSYGYYSYLLDSGWSGLVKPEKGDTLFNPLSRSYNAVAQNYEYQDFQEVSAVYLNLKLFLSGAYLDGKDTMRTDLKFRNYISQSPPALYSNSAAPFEFKPHKTFTYNPELAGIVDWVTLEVLNYNFIPVDTVAALLRNDGKIVSAEGNDYVALDMGILPDFYYVIVRHRNHIAALSNYQIYACSAPDLYDFSSAADMVYGSNQKKLKNNLYGLYSGDANYDGVIDSSDFNIYNTIGSQAGHGYITCDYNLDGFTTSSDFMKLAPNIKLKISANIYSGDRKYRKK